MRVLREMNPTECVCVCVCVCVLAARRLFYYLDCDTNPQLSGGVPKGNLTFVHPCIVSITVNDDEQNATILAY